MAELSELRARPRRDSGARRTTRGRPRRNRARQAHECARRYGRARGRRACESGRPQSGRRARRRRQSTRARLAAAASSPVHSLTAAEARAAHAAASGSWSVEAHDSAAAAESCASASRSSASRQRVSSSRQYARQLPGMSTSPSPPGSAEQQLSRALRLPGFEEYIGKSDHRPGGVEALVEPVTERRRSRGPWRARVERRQWRARRTSG